MIQLSPGLAQASFDMLRLIGEQPLVVSDLVEGIRRIGGIACSNVLEFTQSVGWVALNDGGRVQATNFGCRVLKLGDYPPMLRQTLLDYASAAGPPWLQSATFGRARVLAFAHSSIVQVLAEAEVTRGSTEEVVKFWDALASIAHGKRSDRQVEIGRLGERLTIAHEQERTGTAPRWVSIDNNEDGYDVLSVVDRASTVPLPIEVKASVVGLRGLLIITRNEWEIATEAPNHQFHLWDLSTIDAPRLAKVPSAEMLRHVPNECGQGVWKTAAIPFSAFMEKFA